MWAVCRLCGAGVGLLPPRAGRGMGGWRQSLEPRAPHDSQLPPQAPSTRRTPRPLRRWLEPVPQPRREDPPDGPLANARPLVAVVPAAAGGGGDAALQGGGSGGRQGEQHRVQLYSLRLQDWVRTLTFGSEVLAVQCSSRVIVVALRGQLQAFDAVTLEHTLSCLTYSPPPSWQPPPPPQQQQQRAGERRAAVEGQDGLATGVPCALGPRWLAYAADQVSIEEFVLF